MQIEDLLAKYETKYMLILREKNVGVYSESADGVTFHGIEPPRLATSL